MSTENSTSASEERAKITEERPGSVAGKATKARMVDDKREAKLAQLKKGRTSWKRFRPMDVDKKYLHPDWHYRWVSNEPENFYKKTQEGWVPATEENGLLGEGGAEILRINSVQDGKATKGDNIYRNMVLMAIPMEARDDREKQMLQRADAALERVFARPKEDIKEQAGNVATFDGKIEISI